MQPVHLEVIDESHMHSRRQDKNSAESHETHFKIIIVSAAFIGLSKVKRQQIVYSFVTPLFQMGLHALSQATYTPEEWDAQPRANPSPVCASVKNHT